MTTISDNDRITGPLQPPAGSTQLSTDFPVFDSDDVVVLRRVGGGDWVRLSLGVDYTVSNLEQDAGAVINLQQPVQAGEEYLLIGSMLPQPGLEQVYGERISSTEINRELGRLWAAIQELKRASGQRDTPGAQPLMLPAGEKETLPTATKRAGLLLEFDDKGKPITRLAIDSLGEIHTIRWRGEWQAGVAYQPLDVIGHNNVSYIVTAAHTADAATEPGVGASWQSVMDVLVQTFISAGSITSVELADGNVIEAKLADGAVTTLKIADGAVTTPKLEGTVWHDGNFAARIAALSENAAPTGTEKVPCDDGRKVSLAAIASLVNTETAFESAELAVPAAQSVTQIAHGLGVVPRNVQAKLICKVADLGYSPGDILIAPTDYNYGFYIYADIVNVYIGGGINGCYIKNKTSATFGYITNSSWRVVLMAWV